MNRRDFLRAASGVAGGAAAAGAATSAAASADTTTTTSSGTGSGNATTTTAGGNATTTGGNTTKTSGGGGGGGPTKTVEVGPGGNLVFKPDSLTIAPGTTVKWVWKSDNHNVTVDSQPDGANWTGSPGSPEKTHDEGYTYSHTFNTEGKYSYYCRPHKAAGMTATLTVAKGGAAAAAKKVDPREMGVPLQPHYVGIAALFGVMASLMFVFYVLKYGESPNTSSPNRK